MLHLSARDDDQRLNTIDHFSWPQDEETTATIGVDFKVKQLEVEGRKYKLSIWVSLGYDRHSSP